MKPLRQNNFLGCRFVRCHRGRPGFLAQFAMLVLMAGAIQAQPAIGKATVSEAELRSALRRTAGMMSIRREKPPVFNSTEFSLSKGSLRLVSTDGWRLAVVTLAMSNTPQMALRAIVDNDFLRRLLDLIREDSLVQISVTETAVQFDFDKTTKIAATLDSDFVTWEKELVGKQNQTAVISRQEAIRVLQGISSDSVMLKIAGNDLSFSSTQNDPMGKIKLETETRAASEICINPMFLMDFFSRSDDDKIEIGFSDSALKPIRLKVHGKDNFVCYFMPKKLD